MSMQKIHLKLKNKPLCGTRKKVRKLRYSETHGDVTCGNCRRAIAS
jgi:hypothetical protein